MNWMWMWMWMWCAGHVVSKINEPVLLLPTHN